MSELSLLEATAWSEIPGREIPIKAPEHRECLTQIYKNWTNECIVPLSATRLGRFIEVRKLVAALERSGQNLKAWIGERLDADCFRYGSTASISRAAIQTLVRFATGIEVSVTKPDVYFPRNADNRRALKAASRAYKPALRRAMQWLETAAAEVAAASLHAWIDASEEQWQERLDRYESHLEKMGAVHVDAGMAQLSRYRRTVRPPASNIMRRTVYRPVYEENSLAIRRASESSMPGQSAMARCVLRKAVRWLETRQAATLSKPLVDLWVNVDDPQWERRLRQFRNHLKCRGVNQRGPYVSLLNRYREQIRPRTAVASLQEHEAFEVLLGTKVVDLALWGARINELERLSNRWHQALLIKVYCDLEARGERPVDMVWRCRTIMKALEQRGQDVSLSRWLVDQDPGPDTAPEQRWQAVRKATLALCPTVQVGMLKAILMSELERLRPGAPPVRSTGLQAEAYRELVEPDDVDTAIEKARELTPRFEELEHPWHRAYMVRLLSGESGEDRRSIKLRANTAIHLLKKMEGERSAFDAWLSALDTGNASSFEERWKAAVPALVKAGIDKKSCANCKNLLKLGFERKDQGRISPASSTWPGEDDDAAKAIDEDLAPAKAAEEAEIAEAEAAAELGAAAAMELPASSSEAAVQDGSGPLDRASDACVDLAGNRLIYCTPADKAGYVYLHRQADAPGSGPVRDVEDFEIDLLLIARSHVPKVADMVPYRGNQLPHLVASKGEAMMRMVLLHDDPEANDLFCEMHAPEPGESKAKVRALNRRLPPLQRPDEMDAYLRMFVRPTRQKALLQYAVKTVEKGGGACDDMAALMIAHLLDNGLCSDHWIVYGADVDHSFTLVGTGDKWIVFDPWLQHFVPTTLKDFCDKWASTVVAFPPGYEVPAGLAPRLDEARKNRMSVEQAVAQFKTANPEYEAYELPGHAYLKNIIDKTPSEGGYFSYMFNSHPRTVFRAPKHPDGLVLGAASVIQWDSIRQALQETIEEMAPGGLLEDVPFDIVSDLAGRRGA